VNIGSVLAGTGDFSFFEAFTLAVGLICPNIQWVLETFCGGLKQLGHEVDH